MLFVSCPIGVNTSAWTVVLTMNCVFVFCVRSNVTYSCYLLYHSIFSMCCTYFSQLDSLLMTKFNFVSFSYPFKLIMLSDYG